MKKTVFALLISLLGLSACGGSASPKSSSIESIDSSSSEEIPFNWPADDIAALVSSVLGSDIAIPEPSEELDAGRDYVVEAVGKTIEITASGDFTGYVDEAISAGWIKVDASIVYGETVHLHDGTGTIAIEVDPYDEETDTTLVTILENGNYYGIWPSVQIEEAMETLLGTGFTALPSFDGATFYNLYQGDGYCGVFAFGLDLETVAETISNASFNLYRTYTSAKIFFDPLFSYRLTIQEYSDYGGYTAIEVAELGDTYLKDWPTETAANAVTYLSSESETVIPEPTDYDLIVIDDNLSYSWIRFHVLSFDEGALATDIAEDYIALLSSTESGWLYIEERDIYTDTSTYSLGLSILVDESTYNSSYTIQLSRFDASDYVNKDDVDASAIAGTYVGVALNTSEGQEDYDIVLTIEDDGGGSLVFYRQGSDAAWYTYTVSCTYEDGVFSMNYKIGFTFSNTVNLDYDETNRTIEGTMSLADGYTYKIALVYSE